MAKNFYHHRRYIFCIFVLYIFESTQLIHVTVKKQENFRFTLKITSEN